MTAIALIGGTAGTKSGALTNDALTPNTADVNNVFADPYTLADNANATLPRHTPSDAKAFARGAYRVVSVATNVTKSATCSPTPANCSQA